MKLAWGERSIELWPLGYQFPDHTPWDDRDWDANWLVMRGRIKDPDRAWTFDDPCMTTWEVEKLCGWLRQLAEGGRAVQHISFLEPNVSFEAVQEPTRDITLIAYFGHESKPPDWLDPEPYEVRISFDADALNDAADQLERELSEFPVR